MNKIQGKQSDFAYVRQDGSRTVVGYGLKPIDGSDDYTWREVYLPRKQYPIVSLQTVKDAIIADINAVTDEKILSGFVWNDKPVWLSEENQRNFSEAQRVAMMVPEQILPVTFKLGEQADGTPVYHEFQNAEELTAFYLQSVAYINQQLQQGWQEKDAIDWSPYDALFPAAGEEQPASEE